MCAKESEAREIFLGLYEFLSKSKVINSLKIIYIKGNDNEGINIVEKVKK